ncbi:hypothetical protein PAMA_008361 [Pampus argenteus]
MSGTEGKVADVMLRFSRPTPFNRTPAMRRRKKTKQKEIDRKKTEGAGGRGARFYSEAVNRCINNAQSHSSPSQMNTELPCWTQHPDNPTPNPPLNRGVNCSLFSVSTSKNNVSKAQP